MVSGGDEDSGDEFDNSQLPSKQALLGLVTSQKDSGDSIDLMSEIRYELTVYARRKKTMHEVDCLANELRQAMELRKSMESCISKRLDSDLPPITVITELRCLHDGATLCIITITNNSAIVLKDWFLTIVPSYTSTSTSRGRPPTVGEAFCISELHGNQTREFQIVLSDQARSIPLLCKICITKCFKIENDPSWFRIYCDDFALSFLNLLTFGGHISSSTPSLLRSVFSIEIPSSLVCILSGTFEREKAADALKLLLHPSRLASTIADNEEEITVIANFLSHQEHILLRSRREHRKYIIDIAHFNNESRHLIKTSIYLYLLTMIAKVKTGLSLSLSCCPDLTSLEETYLSVSRAF